MAGPPGTGKTWVGIKIVQLLLQNSVGMSTAERANPIAFRANPLSDNLPVLPIVCVCYTNHALDQFLEGLVNSGVDVNDVIRLGGRSKSPLFSEQPTLEARARQHSSKYAVKLTYDDLDGLSDSLEQVQRDLAAIEDPHKVEVSIIEEHLGFFHGTLLYDIEGIALSM